MMFRYPPKVKAEFADPWNPTPAEQAEWLDDMYRSAYEQKPKLTLMWHIDGSEEELAQMFEQTPFRGLIGRLHLMLKILIYVLRYEWSGFFRFLDLFFGPDIDYARSTLTLWRSYVYGLKYMTECEAEIMANLEMHLDLYNGRERYWAPADVATARMFVYPPLTEDDYFVGFRNLLTQEVSYD